MYIRRFIIILVAACSLFTASVESGSASPNPQVEFMTNKGSFIVELYPEKAPQTVANFMQYVSSGFYQGTTFHRTIERFMIQGGGLDENLSDKRTLAPILNESNNGLKNEPGTLAMARAYEPHSATSQFFINLTDNKFLNFYKPEPAYIGYAVFGKVIRGMETVERISKVPTRKIALHQNVPVEPVIIEKVAILDKPVQAESTPLPSGVTSDKPKTRKSSVKGKKRD
jgi:peptidyl-prolyl cis-trans isomerase A (cyclophilin A)